MDDTMYGSDPNWFVEKYSMRSPDGGTQWPFFIVFNSWFHFSSLHVITLVFFSGSKHET